MADIVDRLNEPDTHYPGNFDTPARAVAILTALCQEAADEIERLRAEIAAMQEWKELAKQYKTELDAARQQEPVGEVVTTLDFPYNTVGRLYTNKHLPLGTLLYAESGAAPYDQTSLELCDTCGWKARIPGECCLMCRYQEEAK